MTDAPEGALLGARAEKKYNYASAKAEMERVLCKEFLEDFIALRLGSDDVKLDVHIGLKGQDIGHSKNPGVHRGGVLDLERADHGRPRNHKTSICSIVRRVVSS